MARSASALFAPSTAKTTRRPAFEHREGERHAPRVRERRPGSDDPAFGLSQGIAAGEQAGGVAVGPHAEPDEVERGRLVAAGVEGQPQLALVRHRGEVEVGRLGLHAVNPIGTHVRQVGDEHPVRHAEVRLRVVRRHGALVAPEELDPAPVDRVAAAWLEDHRVDGLGRAAAGERDAIDAVLVDRLHGRLDDAVGHRGADRLSVREHREAGHAAASRAEARRMAAARIASS